MNKDEFRSLFLRNVEQAVSIARGMADLPSSPAFQFELHGAGVAGQITPFDRLIDLMYLGESLFYPMIDIGVKAASNNEVTVFVRITAYEPCPFDRTWNTPKGNGPFRVLEPMNLRIT
jgi:hypothetical protein